MNEQAELLRLGARLRHIRRQQRMSVTELAARSGIAHQRIRDLEAGRFDPPYDVLIALADGLGVPLVVLVADDSDL